MAKTTEKTSADRGQKIVMSTGPEREKSVDGTKSQFSGDKMGGSSTDLSHSITGGGKVAKAG